MNRFGCIRDKEDGRDYLMKGFLPKVKLPKKLDLIDKMTPVRNQGDEGTCVAFASVVGMKEYQEKIDYKKFVSLSPRFLYNECKKIDGFPDEEGTTIRSAMQVLQKIGVCQEEFWPYSPHQTDKPKEGTYENAEKFKIIAYARIADLGELKQSLFLKGAVVIGVEVFEGMRKPKNGIIPMPGRYEESLGLHAICIRGFDDYVRLAPFKNSWDTEWGNKGYGYFPYKYIEKYATDMWSSVDINDPNPLGKKK